MNKAEILRKAASDEGMTVEEIKAYRKLVEQKPQVYGKYGTLAKQYLEEHNPAKFWAWGGDLTETEIKHRIEEEILNEIVYV